MQIKLERERREKTPWNLGQVTRHNDRTRVLDFSVDAIQNKSLGWYSCRFVRGHICLQPHSLTSAQPKSVETIANCIIMRGLSTMINQKSEKKNGHVSLCCSADNTWIVILGRMNLNSLQIRSCAVHLRALHALTKNEWIAWAKLSVVFSKWIPFFSLDFNLNSWKFWQIFLSR